MKQGYHSINELSKIWGVSERRIQLLCKMGRIDGAEKVGHVWLIPGKAEKPEDSRRSSQKNRVSFQDLELDTLEIEDLYGPSTQSIQNNQICSVYQTRHGSGSGVITQYNLFEGIQLFYHDFHTDHLDYGNEKPSFPGKVISIQHCIEGRFEGCYPNGEFFYLGEGDLSVNLPEYSPSGSSFPLSHFHGSNIVVFVDAAKKAMNEVETLLGDLELDFDQMYERLRAENKLVILRANPYIEHLFGEMYQQNYRGNAAVLKLKVLGLLHFLCNSDLKVSGNRPYFYKNQVLKVKEIQTMLTENLDKHFTLEQISDQYQIPITSLKKCFKTIYGSPVQSYMREFRLHNAAELLRTSRCTVAEIAQNVGYESPSKFTEAFKKRMHDTPSDYRNNFVLRD